jgi:hypothetical protein
MNLDSTMLPSPDQWMLTSLNPQTMILDSPMLTMILDQEVRSSWPLLPSRLAALLLLLL